MSGAMPRASGLWIAVPMPDARYLSHGCTDTACLREGTASSRAAMDVERFGALAPEVIP